MAARSYAVAFRKAMDNQGIVLVAIVDMSRIGMVGASDINPDDQKEARGLFTPALGAPSFLGGRLRGWPLLEPFARAWPSLFSLFPVCV